MNDVKEFAKKMSLKFKDYSILEQVFIHRSYINEHRNSGLQHNERLEFLGDAVLELAVTEHLFNKYNRPEGEMTAWRSALVKGESLSYEAKKIGIENYLKVSRGEAKNTGKARDLILANTFEALLGAIYLDLGYNVAEDFVKEHIIYKLEDILENNHFIDAKSQLQELSQEKFSITPSYETVSEIGPDHNKKFVVDVLIDKKKIGQGEGKSKQKAQTFSCGN